MIDNRGVFLIILMILLTKGIVAENFTIVVLPDTQMYSELYPKIFDSQTKWIVENKDSLNIKAVIHLGDLVNNPNKTEQWVVAKDSMSILNGRVPYLVLPGNHDMDGDNLTNYIKYFDKINDYILLDDVWIGILTIRYDPSISDLIWANDIIANYPEYKFIIATHSYINYQETGILKRDEFIFNELIRKNKNILLITSGHTKKPTEEFSISKREDKSGVCEILSNYQETENGGNGILRYYVFIPSEEKIIAYSYSPYTNNYSTNFTLRYNHSGCYIYSEKPKFSLFSLIFNRFHKTYSSFQIGINYACINGKVTRAYNPDYFLIELPTAEEKCLQECILNHNIGLNFKYEGIVECRDNKNDPFCDCKVGLWDWLKK